MVIDGRTVVVDTPLGEMSGNMTSKAVDADSALFELYTNWVKSDGTTEFMKLDDITVASFLPGVTISTSSLDSHVPTTTRADENYTVSVNVSGLLSAPTDADYTKSVVVGRGYIEYSLANYSATTSSATYHSDQWVTQTNGAWSDTRAHSLPGDSTDKAAGAEIISVFLHPDSGLDYRLASAEVLIMPTATASIDNIFSGQVFRTAPTGGEITVTDAYPRSTTYARIYKGGTDDSSASATTISGTSKTVNGTNKPQSFTLSYGNLQAYLPTDGLYTMQVVTLTPFEEGIPKVLEEESFTINRSVTINGNIHSAE